MAVKQLDNWVLRKWDDSDCDALADIEYDPIVKEYLESTQKLRTQ